MITELIQLTNPPKTAVDITGNSDVPTRLTERNLRVSKSHEPPRKTRQRFVTIPLCIVTPFKNVAVRFSCILNTNLLQTKTTSPPNSLIRS